MHQELELKFPLDKEQLKMLRSNLESILLTSPYTLIEERILHIEDNYYDTDEYTLLNNHAGFRLRVINRQLPVITLKESLPDGKHKRLKRRLELEGEPGEAIATLLVKKCTLLNTSRLAAALEANEPIDKNSLIALLSLKPVIKFSNRRTEFRLLTEKQDELSLCIDQILHSKGKTQKRFAELELELITGKLSALRNLARFLEAQFHISTDKLQSNKYETVLRHAGLYEKLKGSHNANQLEQWTGQFRSIYERLRDILPKSLEFEDPNDLHKTRVCMLQLHTLLQILKYPALPKNDLQQLSKLSGAVKDLQSILGEVRDLDVFLEKVIPKYGSQNKEFTVQLIALIKKERDSKRLSCILHIDKRKQANLLSQIQKFIDQRLARITSRVMVEHAIHDQKLKLRSLYNEVLRIKDTLGIQHSKTLKALHKVRIQAKKIRYTIEYLSFTISPLLQQETGQFKKIQDNLGNLNDLYNYLNLLNRIKAEFSRLLSVSFEDYRSTIQEEINVLLKEAFTTLDDLPKLTRDNDSSIQTESNRLIQPPGDLLFIKGIGEKYAAILGAYGVFSLQQLARLKMEDLDKIESDGISIKNRAINESWVDQAREYLENRQKQR